MSRLHILDIKQTNKEHTGTNRYNSVLILHLVTFISDDGTLEDSL